MRLVSGGGGCDGGGVDAAWAYVFMAVVSSIACVTAVTIVSLTVFVIISLTVVVTVSFSVRSR